MNKISLLCIYEDKLLSLQRLVCYSFGVTVQNVFLFRLSTRGELDRRSGCIVRLKYNTVPVRESESMEVESTRW